MLAGLFRIASPSRGTTSTGKRGATSLWCSAMANITRYSSTKTACGMKTPKKEVFRPANTGRKHTRTSQLWRVTPKQ